VFGRVSRAALVGSSALWLPLAAGVAHAQNAAPGAPAGTAVQEVVITGSRIARRDYTSESPIVTVTGQSLQNTSQVSIDQQLTKLPQFVAGQNQTTSAADVQATPTNSPGIATVNLRGLGPNRTLVLLDGRRTQPNNASLVVDLNTIPSAAVDSVEIITGGAAATYGADAVAGVVNFKLKQNYQGVTLDAQYGETFRGDGAQTQISGLIGGNFADNKGNALISATYSKRDAVYTIDRPFFAAAYTDPGVAGVNPFPNFAGFAGPTFPTQAAVNSVFGAMGYAPGDYAPSTTFYFNPASATSGSTLFALTPGKISGKAPGFTGTLYPNSKFLSNGTLSSNAPEGFLSLPLERYSVFANGHYDVNDHVTVYGQANFDQNRTQTQQGFAAPSFNQWALSIPHDAAHPVPAELETLLDSRANPSAPWTLYHQLNYLGPERMETTTHTYELLGGVKGDIGFRDWTYDLYGSHGRTDQLAVYNGFADLLKLQTLIAMPNYGAGADFNNGRTGQLAHCTSGINPFVNTPVSQDCKDIVQSVLKTSTELEQDQVELDVQGSLAQVPAGDLRFAVGADYRGDSFRYLPDPTMSTTNITSLALGLFDTSPTGGSIKVFEGYGELLIPVLRDMPFAKALNLDAGYRFSSYDTATGGVSTWKITADWSVNNWLKFRGGYQVANRAPNVAELFQPATFSTVPWPDHDPCSILTRAPYGNVASNPDRAKVQALCTALTRDSAGKTFTIDSNYVGNVPAYFPLGRDLTIGNPDVQSEDAKTWTVGTVIRSPVDSPALRRLTLSVDYYNATIDGAIAPTTTQTAYQECFNGFSGSNPTYDPNNPYCKLLIRTNVNGFWIATKAQYANLGSLKTSGVDAQLDWSMDAPGLNGAPGTVFANVTFNWLQAYDVQQIAGGPTIHYAGTIGAATNGSGIGTPPYGAQFRWKLYSTLGYTFGPATVSVSWRHLPSAKNVQLATNPNSTALSTGAYDEFDLAARWSITPTYELRGGIENLFDKDPNIVGAIPGVTTAAGVTDTGAYDVLGRRFYVGVKARF
jgi:outer membrane receptor protein involved in Fe transport